MYKILLVDDDIEVFNIISEYNKENKENYEFFHLTSGEFLNEFLNKHTVHAILMDWKLENECGLSLIKKLKSKDAFSHIPTILLTSKTDLADQIQGLDEGADDYILKPFSIKFLFSKINAFLRKENKSQNITENVRHKFIFHDDSLQVEYFGEIHKLTHKEYIILKTLVENPLKVFSQLELNELTSGKDVFISKRCIDTFITILRKKIGKDSIVSVRKKGYKINEKYIQEAKENDNKNKESSVLEGVIYGS